MTSYYDYVLGLIPAVMIGLTAVLSVWGVQLTAAVPVGAAGAIAVIAHALFVRVPGRVESAAGRLESTNPPAASQRQVNTD